MRLFLFLLLVCVIPSYATLNLIAVAGYSGNVSSNDTMPIAITIINDGNDINGEFVLTSGNIQNDTRICKDFYFPAVIPASSKKLVFIYCNASDVQTNFKLSFVSKGKIVASTMVTARPYSTNDRFIISAGGQGLNFLNGVTFDATVNYSNKPVPVLKKVNPGFPQPAPAGIQPYTINMSQFSNDAILPVQYYDVMNGDMIDSNENNGYRNYNSMNILTGSVEPNLLPDNAEGYRGAEILYLPSNVTENSFNSPRVKDAIIGWVSNGGCLLIGNGGIPGRFDTGFFKSLLPKKGKKVNLIGLGKVVLLDFDPESGSTAKEKSTLGGIVFSLKHSGSFLAVSENIDMMPVSVKPPSVSAIILYLIIYILVVSPINYFVLKKMDKRELAWKTTPIIAVVFTLIAFSIGLASKGLILYVNNLNVVHSSTGQKTAEMTGLMSVYSPASRAYSIDIGDNCIYGKENNNTGQNEYSYNKKSTNNIKSIKYVFQNSVFSVDDFSMDMWSQRKLALYNQVSLGNGITAEKMQDKTYKITNGSDMDIEYGIVYMTNFPAWYFKAKKGETVVATTVDKQFISDNKDIDKLFQNIIAALPQYINTKGTATKLVCFSTNGNPDIKVSGRKPSSALTVLILNVD